MGELLLVIVGAVVVAAIAFGVAALITGSDPGLTPSEADGRAVPLPAHRPLVESDLSAVRFDTGLRGYRMAQVDAALRRAAYDIGYKQELIGVLEAEVAALRDGRQDDADALAQARLAALAAPSGAATDSPDTDDGVSTEVADQADPGVDGDAAAQPDDAAPDQPWIDTRPERQPSPVSSGPRLTKDPWPGPQ